ncbi:MAG TPA: hypothetical protein VD998_04205 [Verrucomicrobiae bacterium]|nr:hypothetical protein [Verrucomicrobiae bacterium]
MSEQLEEPIGNREKKVEAVVDGRADEQCCQCRDQPHGIPLLLSD